MSDTTAQSTENFSIKSLLNKFSLNSLKGQIKEKTTITPTFFTPTEWGDEDGLFYGNNQAWLYRQLPISIVAEQAETLDVLLQGLAKLVGKRNIHLVVHGWEETAEVPPNVSSPGYVKDSLRMLVPRHTICIGVQLKADPDELKKAQSAKNVLFDIIDKSLEEWVPNLDMYDTDRERISHYLETFGATQVTQVALRMLEQWYTLGVPKDLELTEEDDHIFIRDTEVIELLSIRSFAETLPQVADVLVNPGNNGAVVVSVRGHLTVLNEKDTRGKSRDGALSAASIVVGRRAERGVHRLEDYYSVIDALETKPLPMRQLPALLETLPCHPNKVDPNLYNVNADQLRIVGFSEPTPLGDNSGLYIGLASPNFTYPFFIDPQKDPASRHFIVGEKTSGKTFLLNSLTFQAAGVPNVKLRYLTYDQKSVEILSKHAHLEVISTPLEGMFDPLATLEKEYAADMFIDYLRNLKVNFNDAELNAIQRTWALAAGAEVYSSTQALTLLPTIELKTKMKALANTPVGQLVFLPQTQNSPALNPLATRQIWNLETILSKLNTKHRKATENLAIAIAGYHTLNGGYVLGDEVGDFDQNQLIRNYLDALKERKAQNSFIITVGDHALLSDRKLPLAENYLVLAGNVDPAKVFFTRRGITVDDDLSGWLDASGPIVEDHYVIRTATGLAIDRKGRTNTFAVGPIPTKVLPLITDTQAVGYLADHLR